MINLSEIMQTLIISRTALSVSKELIDKGLSVSTGGRYEFIASALERVETQIEEIFKVINTPQDEAANDVV